MQLDNGLDKRAKRKQLQKERRRAFSKKLIEEAHNKDCQSYSKDVITVEEQARREPDFIGRHWVYNLNAQSVRLPSHQERRLHTHIKTFPGQEVHPGNICTSLRSPLRKIGQ